MDWKYFLLLALANWTVFAKEFRSLRKFLELIQRRVENEEAPVLIVAGAEADELPEAAPSPPGHALLQPARDTLQSAAKYPLKDVAGTLVYGNLDNLGITFGKTNQRILYSGFRRNTDVLENLLRLIKNKLNPGYSRNKIIPIIVIRNKNNIGFKKISHEEQDYLESRRRTSKKKKHRDRKDDYFTDDDSDKLESSDSDKDEKSPDNPYTVHKNRYKQNWMWNFAMTGDHMNVNPKAPQFNNFGPSGGDIFFARKWWYFNQDDYMPFR